MPTINDYPNAKPILFNTDMVQAILDGRKTVTRRVVKPQPNEMIKRCENCDPMNCCDSFDVDNFEKTVFMRDGARCYRPYLKGDILYVRETWQYIEGASGHGYAYKAGGGVHNDTGKWRPSIHMSKSAARIFLRVTGVRVERLQDITPSECLHEGVEPEAMEVGGEFVRGIFNGIWNSTIKPADLPRYGWDANPWVWVYEFERVSENA